ncbi:hypothetical protein G5714_010098 [Onychostoma macrolepis]|uniref:Uncharacterized protein n=1 Tax=Onychostoma macrolepis TaxID=369639 RepID=A0A7J6CR12_9TELE|nr:hypothetical protein G5714_010098 [Onychostoma macrolepis]
MEKEKEKVKGLYREKLNNTAKQRYLEKLFDINNIDPYDLPSATAGQILPILDKLKKKFKVEEDDSAFKRAIKEKVWTDLSPRYTYERNYDLQRFLEEATALDVRFKSKVQHEAVWAPLEKEAVTFASRNKGGEVTQEEKGEELLQQEEEEEQDHRFTEDRKPAAATAHTALGELFKDEDQALLVLERVKMDVRGPSVTEKAKKEIQPSGCRDGLSSV